MAIRSDFTAGEILSAVDLNDTFASKLPIAGGKILQIVRATDSTERTTTSASYVDAGISVTITPQKSDSAVVLIHAASGQTANASTGDSFLDIAITDNSNNVQSGGQANFFGIGGIQNSGTKFATGHLLTIAYATPATTSAVTFKTRFRVAGTTTATLRNALNTGQMYAIEVSA